MHLDYPFIWTAFKFLLAAVPLTLLMTILPILFGFIIALLVTYIRLYKIKVLAAAAGAYVSFFRSTPAILHVMLIYLGIPVLIIKFGHIFGIGFNANKIPVFIFVIAAFSLTAGAYLSEAVRSGILAVDTGEAEAGYAIGLTHSQVIRRIVLPQALFYALPNFVNLFVGFFHTTSIASIVAVPEITGKAIIAASNNYEFLEAYIAAAIIYWGITILFEWLAHLTDQKLSQLKGGIT
ncbi:amino acid ABC transporter permease [Heyndrickxia coagulans]|uniref:amino acid ABC transporter permease n=1 Tax=Heyndrickxia coagulans TaxID=1398 RepID=UPI000779510B|nr:amino acid ABC transporter permease [Heyndrickxia coagulans]KYC82922.1 hypothetical protein B4096_1916 [Heyndrickxia coagulans]